MATRLVTALARGLDILTLLKGGPRSAPDIAAALSIPRATAHELLKTLEAQGFIEPCGGGFALSMRLLELGSAVERSLDIAQLGRRYAESVAAECGETVQVALLDGVDVVYVAKVDSAHAVKLVSAVGARLPAHLTAVGKATLAYLPTEELDRHYPPGQALSTLTDNSISSTDRLRKELEGVHGEGVAWDNCESNPDVCCVAAPVRNTRGAAIGGMSVSVPTYRWNRELAGRLRLLVTSGATALSEALGYRAVSVDTAS
jgi:IclR family transcriptional regulator, KDG regulon repressor